jgi:hypothetical protein
MLFLQGHYRPIRNPKKGIKEKKNLGGLEGKDWKRPLQQLFFTGEDGREKRGMDRETDLCSSKEQKRAGGPGRNLARLGANVLNN